MAEKYISGSGLQYAFTKIKTNFVAKESGKGLSTNDYTTTEKSKLNGIASNAQVNVIETVKVNGTALTPSSKAVNVTVPTKVSQLTNDSKFITAADVPEGAAASTTTPLMDSTNGAVGSETAFARGDHSHPKDTSKVDKTTTINNKALSSNITLNAGDVGAVPTSTTINGKALSGNITLSASDVGAAEEEHTHLYAGASTAGGAATSASKLATARTISLSGDATGSTTFDGSADKSIAVTLANSGVTAGSYGLSSNATPAYGATFNVPYITVDAKGRVTAASTKTVKIPASDKVTVDTAMSSTSTNPVQNKVVNTALSAKAPLASPALTGTPTAPTAEAGTNTTQIATTAFVQGELGNYVDLTSDQVIGGLKDFESIQSGVITLIAGNQTQMASKRLRWMLGSQEVASIDSANYSGTAYKAKQLATARNITIGNQTVSFNGSAAISFSLSDIGAIATSAKGVANGVATLDADGKVPSTQLPSYVDDVIEGYYYNGKFYQESAHTNELIAMGGKIYVDLATNKTYRYGGTTYVEISSGDMVALTNAEIDTLYSQA